MAERVETVVVGGGQAGLAVSWHLSRLGREHVVLERGRVGESWRSERWDSFRLNTPSFFLQLPGHGYDGDEPEGFLDRDETVAYHERDAERSTAAVRAGVEVTRVRRGDGRFAVETSARAIEADNVVAATGTYRRAAPPPDRAGVGVPELSAAEYRSPAATPDGAVLVVGNGQTGCQIADDLNRGGRRVFLALGRCPTVPLYYRGRNFVRWALDCGLMDDTVDTLAVARRRARVQPDDHERRGRTPLRPAAARAGGVVLSGACRRARTARRSSRPTSRRPWPSRTRQAPRCCGGSTRTPRRLGRPAHTAGAADAVPGLYFAGLHWQTKRKSALLVGVGEDAGRVAEAIAAPSRA